MSADRVDWVGEMAAEVPFFSRGRHDAWFAVDLRTDIEDATSDLEFEVRDVAYRLDLGWAMHRARGPGLLQVFAGQRGIEPVDDVGGGWVRYAAVGFESRSFAARFEPPGRKLDFRWRFALGPVLSDLGVDADAWARGEARLRRPLGRHGAFVLDLRTEGVAGGDVDGFDVSGGPGFEIPIEDGGYALFFLHYQHADSPFGIGDDGLWVGLEYAREPPGEAHPGAAPARAIGEATAGSWSGRVLWGAGDEDRGTASFALQLGSPRFGSRSRARVGLAVDANVLTGTAADEIWWRYELGVEQVLSVATRGIYLYHRSNHRLAQFASGSTGINVVEAGYASLDWRRPGTRDRRSRFGSFDYLARLGWVVNSSFGEDGPLQIRAGLRWAMPVALGGLTPFVRFYVEQGDVEVREWGLGLSASRALDLQLEYRDDEQAVAPDKTAFLLTASYAF